MKQRTMRDMVNFWTKKQEETAPQRQTEGSTETEPIENDRSTPLTVRETESMTVIPSTKLRDTELTCSEKTEKETVTGVTAKPGERDTAEEAPGERHETPPRRPAMTRLQRMRQRFEAGGDKTTTKPSLPVTAKRKEPGGTSPRAADKKKKVARLVAGLERKETETAPSRDRIQGQTNSNSNPHHVFSRELGAVGQLGGGQRGHDGVRGGGDGEQVGAGCAPRILPVETEGGGLGAHARVWSSQLHIGRATRSEMKTKSAVIGQAAVSVPTRANGKADSQLTTGLRTIFGGESAPQT